jgi:tRNA G37 N-methylase TrmD
MFSAAVRAAVMAEPVYNSWVDAVDRFAEVHRERKSRHLFLRLIRGTRTIYLSTRAADTIRILLPDSASISIVILLCGHYEGVDQRVLDKLLRRDIIGDFVAYWW